MKITFELMDSQLANVLESASSAAWAKVIRYDVDKFMRGDVQAIKLQDFGDEVESQGEYRLTKSAVQRGVTVIAEKYPHLLEQIVDENETDAYTGDYLIQCAIFGELKYS